LLNVTSNDPPGLLIPESNSPSGAPGVPEVTVCGSPANVHRTTSPTFTVRVAGWKSKLTAATVTVAAATEAVVSMVSRTSDIDATTEEPTAIRLPQEGTIDGSYVATPVAGSLGAKPVGRDRRIAGYRPHRPQRH